MASTFRFVWDGNVLLHETFKKDNSENTELTTWVFEGFVPTAKLVNSKAYSIISDHLGTPILAIDSEGNEVWNRQLDIYGRVKREIKASSLGDDVRPFIPFLYQGQYYDFETKLAYNRFRYYSPETGAYISQDPIRLNGNNPTLYAYVGDNNWWVDVFGLDCENKPIGSKGNPFKSLKHAMYRAKELAGVPKSQQFIRQWRISKDIEFKGSEQKNMAYHPQESHEGRIYEYEVPKERGGIKNVVVVVHTNDDKLHVHAGKAKDIADFDFKKDPYQKIIDPKLNDHHLYVEE